MNNKVNKLEIHYYLKDGSHSMNAFVRNKAEKDYIYSFLKKILNLHVDLTILSQDELLETKLLVKIGNFERLK